MAELEPRHIEILERFVSAGYAIAAFPMYASAVGVRKGNVAALLEPLPGAALRLIGSPSYLIEGNLSVRIRNTRSPRLGQGEWFVWKSTRVEATSERLEELAAVTEEIRTLLGPA